MDDSLREIREECQRRLREVSGSPVFWPIETLNKYINDGYLDITRRTGCLWDRVILNPSGLSSMTMDADRTVGDGEVMTIPLTSGGSYDINGYTLLWEDGGLIQWFEGNNDSNRKFTLPTNVFEIPRKRVVYDESNHLEFKTLDLMDKENEKWESNDPGTPRSWMQKDTRSIYVDPPVADAGETYTCGSDVGRAVRIVDSENTYTFSSEVGRIVRIQDDNAEGDCYSFTSETGVVVRTATPVGNISIWYKKEPDELIDGGDSPEMHEIFKYVLYSYVLWKALSLKGEGQNLKIAMVHLEEYELQLADLMAIGKGMVRGHRTRLQS